MQFWRFINEARTLVKFGELPSIAEIEVNSSESNND